MVVPQEALSAACCHRMVPSALQGTVYLPWGTDPLHVAAAWCHHPSRIPCKALFAMLSSHGAINAPWGTVCPPCGALPIACCRRMVPSSPCRALPTHRGHYPLHVAIASCHQPPPSRDTFCPLRGAVRRMLSSHGAISSPWGTICPAPSQSTICCMLPSHGAIIPPWGTICLPWGTVRCMLSSHGAISPLRGTA